jgi:hypothetical protein
VAGLICTLRESLSVHFFSLIGQFENIVGVVGLICNLREFLWGGLTDLHFKGVFISPFLSF